MDRADAALSATAMYRARWIFPGDGPPVRDGVIAVCDGRIAENALAGNPVDLGNVAVLPGLVNAHTHLEFSSLRSPLEPRTRFARWIRQVIQWRRQRTDSPRNAIRQGMAESLRCGTTVLGEIATHDELAHYHLPGDFSPGKRAGAAKVTVFRELLGWSDEAVERQLQLARQHWQHSALAGVSTGLSPHAPYSVHPELLGGAIELARRAGIPIAMHLAESAAELQLLEQGSGPLVELLVELGVWRGGLIPRGTRPLHYLQQLSEAPRGLVIHGNFLSDEELQFLAHHPQLRVVYCPRTHAAMGHPPHPWQKLLELGAGVAIGTDSRASNPDLSLFEEMRFLKRAHPDVSAAQLVQLGTLEGAKALGREQEAGTLAPGKTADMVVVALPEDSGDLGPDALFHAQAEVIGVLAKGEWLIDPLGKSPKG